MKSIGNHQLMIGLASCAVCMNTAIESHDLKGGMYHAHDDGSFGKVKMPKTCADEGDYKGCGAVVDNAEVSKGYDRDGELVILTDTDLSTVEENSGTAIEILEFIHTKQVQPLLFSGEKAYYLVPDTDKKRGSKASTATYKSIVQVIDEGELAGIVQYTKWGKTRLGLLRTEEAVDADGRPIRVLVIQNMIWPDELRAPEMPAGVRDVQPDERMLPILRTLVESMTVDWNPDSHHDTYQEQLAAAVAAKATGEPIQLDAKPQDAAKPEDEVADLLAKLQESVKAKTKAPAKKAPARKAPARKAS